MARSTPEMRRFFSAWAAAFRSPFVNKNNRLVSVIPELADALPHAVFLVVRRDPLPTVHLSESDQVAAGAELG